MFTPASQPFYAPFNASRPTKGHITEVMNTLITKGARIICSQTLCISVGNPLSLEPSLDNFNPAAFAPRDEASHQARTDGLCIFARRADNYGTYEGSQHLAGVTSLVASKVKK